MIVVETEKHHYGPDSDSWLDISPAEVSNDPVPQELRKQYEQDKKLQRFFG